MWSTYIFYTETSFFGSSRSSSLGITVDSTVSSLHLKNMLGKHFYQSWFIRPFYLPSCPKDLILIAWSSLSLKENIINSSWLSVAQGFFLFFFQCTLHTVYSFLFSHWGLIRILFYFLDGLSRLCIIINAVNSYSKPSFINLILQY